MFDKDCCDTKSLPAGMTHAAIRSEMEHAYAALRNSGDMTDDMEMAFRYAGRLIAKAEFEDFHSGGHGEGRQSNPVGF